MTADHANSRIESCAQVLFKAASEAGMPVTSDLRIDLPEENVWTQFDKPDKE